MHFPKPFLRGLAALSLIALSCSNPVGPDADAQSVVTDRNDLVITFAPGDNADSVTENVVLPATGLSGSAVSWVTNHNNQITSQGTVTRPDSGSGDVLVTLSATISKGKTKKVKEFIVTVKDLSYTGNTISAGTVTDIDGNDYWAVKIGNQVWTVENLRTTKYNDGSSIPYVKSDSDWVNLTTPGYSYFNNMVNTDSIRKFGVLYNWYAIDNKKLAPVGWHVPTDAEWVTLENYLIGSGYNWDGTTKDNKIAKALSAKTNWYTETGLKDGSIGNDLSKNNKSGFLAIPAGSRSTNGAFDFGGSGNWWSATEFNASGGVARNLYYDYDNLAWNSNYKSSGFSVRLLKD